MNEFLLAAPILSIGILAIVSIVFDAINPKNSNFGFAFALISLFVGLAFSVAGLMNSPQWLEYFATTVQDGKTFAISFEQALKMGETLSYNTLSFSKSAYYYDILFLIGAIFTMFASRPYLQREKAEASEYYNLILYAVAGMMIIAHTNHMLTAFIGIETMSITFYILAGYFRFNKKSVEAALKYFLFGAFATGFLVYGMAMIYGGTGSFDLDVISTAISTGNVNSVFYVNIGLAMMIIGLAFKIAAFPFHQWAPDVYSGSPTVITAFMSTAGKAAAVIAFIIIGQSLMPSLAEDVSAEISSYIGNAGTTIAIISAFTMLIGNITAISQKNVKRMLAFSSVAHAGYLLMGIVANNEAGYRGMTFYITAYLFMQIGSFIIVSVLEKEKEKNLEFDDYKGLWKTQPLMAALMAIFMFSLAGIPPMAGFYGKYLLFAATIDAGFVWLTLVAVISSIISMYFYIGLVKTMLFEDKEDGENLEAKPGLAGLPIYISTAVILVLGILPFLVDDLIIGIF